MKEKCVIGVDPGGSGGIAIVGLDRMLPIYEAWPMPKTEVDMIGLLFGTIRETYLPLGCCIEVVHSMPKQGVKSSFTFGQNYGFLRGMLLTYGQLYGMPLRDVKPRDWQKTFGVFGKGASRIAKKNTHKAVAQQLFPNLKITHATADALLIAEWGRRQEQS